MRPPSVPYRPELDGLRAVAVLMVLLFHCGFDTFRGGFVGVDVFFVISGYLITSLILADLRHGNFGFVRFYSRRVRRLFPALLATVLVTLLGASFVMSPEHLVDTAKSGAFATISVSNFYFAMVTRYFDASAHAKPLLHTWSLGVEEQYYLFWPILLFLLYRYGRRWLIPVLIIGGIPAGLMLSEYWIGRNPDHAYFLLPFRTFQFLMGAACIWLLRVDIPNRYVGSAVCLLGLAIILGTACWYSEATPFPGIAAALPSAGAMLVVWQGRHMPVQRLLGNPVAVWLGRISYSTYLIHWPIVVFWLYLSIEPPTLIAKLLLLASCILGGQLLYSLVERRFRYTPAGQQLPRLQFRTGLAVAAGAIALGCGVALVTDGLPGRMALVPDVAEYRRQSVFEFLRDYGDGIFALGPKEGARVLIFGDSMMQNYAPAILRAQGFKDARVDVVSRGGCVLAKDAILVNHGSPDAQCLTLRDHLYALTGPYDVVIWAQNWTGYDNSLHWQDAGGAIKRAFADGADFAGWHTGIERTVDHFGTLAKKIILIGPAITVSNVPPTLTRIGPFTDISAIPRLFSDMRELSSARRDAIDDKLRDLAAHKPDVLYIDPRAIVCMGGECRLWQGRYSYFMDGVHYAAAATEMLRKGLQRQGLALPSR